MKDVDEEEVTRLRDLGYKWTEVGDRLDLSKTQNLIDWSPHPAQPDLRVLDSVFPLPLPQSSTFFRVTHPNED